MKEKELLDREMALLTERVEKFEGEVRDRLRNQDLKIRALELYVATVHPNTSGTSHSIESKIFDESQAA